MYAFWNFYPRPPRGGRQDGGDYLLTGKLFLSTPSARRATVVVDERDLREVISIHALREEGDVFPLRFSSVIHDFYPRPPRGGRQHRLRHIFRPVEFLSTPSARRATRDFHRASSFRSISIHALREEGDPRSIMRLQVRYNFYPRPPRGGRHAIAAPKGQVQNFYPRPPRGGRQTASAGAEEAVLFLSTPSARRATPRASSS